MKDIALYVSLFALGHSSTMLLGVYFNIGINSYIIDAIIGLSVVYKAMDNIGAFKRWFGVQLTLKPRHFCLGSAMALACRQKLLNTISLLTGYFLTCWRST